MAKRKAHTPEEIVAKLRQVEELTDPDKPKVFHVTQCAACQGGLDLPAVHFMCGHSYHQRYVFHSPSCPMSPLLSFCVLNGYRPFPTAA